MSQFWGVSGDGWTAILALVTAGLVITGAVAAILALQQLKELARTRDEQSQPFVVIDLEPSRVSHIHLDLVIRNTGRTVAHDVTFEFSPPLTSTMYDADKALADIAIFKQGLPSLPPGRTWRMLFDNAAALYADEALQRQWDVTVRFKDARRRDRQPLTYRLDVDTFYGFRRFGEQGVHEMAKSLDKIREDVNRWTTSFDGIKVYTVDFEEHQREILEHLEQQEERLRARGEQAEAVPGTDDNAE